MTIYHKTLYNPFIIIFQELYTYKYLILIKILLKNNLKYILKLPAILLNLSESLENFSDNPKSINLSSKLFSLFSLKTKFSNFKSLCTIPI